MALNESTLAEIDGTLAACAPDEAARAIAARLRARLPGLVVMACDAADVIEEPWRRYRAIDLHFVDTRGHCTATTRDPGEATGLLLAAREVAA